MTHLTYRSINVVANHALIGCMLVVFSGTTYAVEPTAVPEPELVDRTITITLGGDTGFSPNHAAVQPRGVRRHGQFQTWADTTAGIAPHVDGDLNFINIETIVTDKNSLRRDTKGQRGPFHFRTHPNGIRHLVERGFNVFSLANNHSMDYGLAGLKETLRHVAQLNTAGLKAAAGLGMNREEASRPAIIPVKGQAISFAAIGIVTNNLARHRAGDTKPGQIAYRFDEDFNLIVDRLKKTDSDYKMLSIHYGLEGRVRTDAMQIRDWRKKAALKHGIDLIVGHHAHVPRGVEIAGTSVIFYGLGNFLHHGTANMSGKGICKDFGVFAKVHLVRNAEGALSTQAIEVIPLTQMHRKAKPMRAAAGRARIHALNYLGSRLGAKDGSARGVQFTPQSDGRGLYCFPGAATKPGKIGNLCRGWKPVSGIPSALRRRIAGSCAR
ncbi:MAG: CapA family protein [Alphaproteobacteria bacterium]|nr:CapA family protein [Alphaproteobacteria bacterium]